MQKNGHEINTESGNKEGDRKRLVRLKLSTTH